MRSMHVKFDQLSDKKTATKTVTQTGKISMTQTSDRDVSFVDHLTFSSPLTGISVAKEPPLLPLRWADYKVRRKDGTEATVAEVIACHPVTLLLFGSPSYEECRELAHKLRALEYVPAVIYVPVYTYREHQVKVEEDFQDNHGDWWMMEFQSLGAVEAAYMCGVAVLPSLVVLDFEGVVVSSYGQLDLARWGEAAVTAWS